MRGKEPLGPATPAVFSWTCTMAFEQCRKMLVEAHGLDDSDAREIIRGLEEILEARAAEPGIEALVMRIAAEQAESAKRLALLQEWRKKLATIANGKIVKRVADFEDPTRGLQSYYVGVEDAKFGALDSIDAYKKTLVAKYLKSMTRELEDGHEGIARIWGEKNFEADIGREMEALPTGKRGTGNDDAFHIAQILDKYKEIIRTELNKRGADRARLAGHVWKQDHDPRLMLKATFEKWKNDILPELDMDRSFGEAGARSDPEEVLEIIFNNITTGRAGTRIGEKSIRPSNLAKQLSASRNLHFKDFDAANRYHQMYSRKGLMESVYHKLVSDLEDMAVLERMGPNPEAQHIKQIDRVAGQLRRKGDPRMKRKIKDLGYQFDAISGKDRIIGDPRWADFGNWMRAVQTWSKLGSSTISSFNDVFTSAAMLNYNGVGFLTAYREMFGGLASGPMTHEKRLILDSISTFSEAMNGQVAGRFTASDGIPGMASKITNIFFKYNTLNWWTDRMKNSHSLGLSRFVANELPNRYGDIPPSLRDQMFRYGIAEKEWGNMQGALKDLPDLDGVKLMTPDNIEALPRFKGRDKLADSLRMFYINEADYGVPTPGAKERAFALRGTQPGDRYGELARFMWQFKMFPLTIMTKVWPRLHRQGVPGYIHLFAGTMLFGYAAMTTKDLLRGRKPRDEFNPKTWIAAALQGGGAGILGDVVFNDFNQYGRSFSEVLLGPAAGAAGDFLKVFSKIQQLEGEAAAAKFFRGAMNNMPFANLYYLRSAVDYLGVYLLQESVNPGYLQRMERQIERNNGQEFLLKPSSVIPRGGLLQ